MGSGMTAMPCGRCGTPYALATPSRSAASNPPAHGGSGSTGGCGGDNKGYWPGSGQQGYGSHARR